jgi:uncharacterized ferritin-like protein (DUF455 family)
MGVADAPISVEEWAQRVLFGRSLADKLFSPVAWSDDRPAGGCGDVQAPGRAVEIAMADRGGVSGPPSSLVDPAERGRLFHFFANHELLAIELMALSLLRFVDAPAAFRRGVVAAMRDEQRHLQSYIEAMAHVGTELGQYPLGGFFWRVMAPMRDPRDFVAHMSLTFEQANLDFALHYAAELVTVGDEDGARRLREVHRDEVGHVAHGRVWFQRWRDKGPSLLEAHGRALRSPTTLRRARGLGFDREGRLAAGLPASYIDALEFFEASRGRPPTVYELHPTAELEHALGGGFNPDVRTRTRIADLATLPMLMCQPGDAVVVPRRPRPAFVRALAEVGLSIPQWLVRGDDSDLAAVGAVRPWGWSSDARRRLAPWIGKSIHGAPPVSSDAALLSKVSWRDLAVDLAQGEDATWLASAMSDGVVVRDASEIVAHVQRLSAAGHAESVVKAPWGTAGRNMQRISHGEPTASQWGWIRRMLRQQGQLIVEPWLDARCDVSIRLTVDDAGVTRLEDVGRFITDARGQYLGAVLGALSRAVSPAIARWLHGEGRDPHRLGRLAQRLARRVGQRAFELGYVGPLGIDGLVVCDPDGNLRWRALVEVNARPTFGHLALGLQRQLAPRSSGVWLLLRAADLPAGTTFAQLVAAARRVAPPRMASDIHRLQRGVVALGDAEAAGEILPLLVVQETVAGALTTLEGLAPRAAARLREALARERGDREVSG